MNEEQSVTTKPFNPILYGALYLDRGERLPNAIEQIDGLRDKARKEGHTVRGFGFDVLYSKREPDSMVERTVTEIEDAIHKAFDGDGQDFLVVVSTTRVKSAAANGPRIAQEWAMKYIESGREAADAYLREQMRDATPTERGIESRTHLDR